MKQVAIIILNYRHNEQTILCVRSVLRSSYKNIKIIVVDNEVGSGLANLLEKMQDVIFIQSKQNLGYSGGNNLGIKHALEIGAEYVFILNPDATVEKETIKKLFTISEQEKAEITGPKVLFGDKKTIWFAGGIFDQDNILGRHRGVNEKNSGKYDRIEEVDYITGAAMFVNRTVFEKIGLFDEKYFLYYEDSDFCFRAKQAGFNIMYIPKAIVYHKNAQSTGLGSPLQDYYISRNRMYFASKFLPLRTRFALFREGINNIGKPIRRRAFFDFLIGNLGKGSYSL